MRCGKCKERFELQELKPKRFGNVKDAGGMRQYRMLCRECMADVEGYKNESKV